MNRRAIMSEKMVGTSHQDGGISRHASPPHANPRRITTKLKTRNTPNCQKTKLYGSPTTKD